VRNLWRCLGLVAFAPGWRLVVAFVVGKRPQEHANLLLDHGVYVTDNHVPFLTSDPCRAITPPCCMPMGKGIRLSDKGAGNGIPPRSVDPCRTCCRPKGSSGVKKDGGSR
jgi:hypothetical protein